MAKAIVIYGLNRSKTNWLLLAVYVLFLLPMVLYGPHDMEEWAGSVWSTLQYSSAIWNGQIPPMWSDALGLGTPLPLGHRLDFAPPFLLFPVVPIRWIFPLFYALYLGIAIIYVVRLCDDFKLGSLMRLVVGLTFLFSGPTVQLMYADDWPTLFHDWCLFPVLFFYLRRLCLNSDREDTLRLIFLLGLVGGLWALNGHSGHMAVLASILSVYVIVMTAHSKGLLLKLAGSIFIASLISSEHMYYLISETMNFPADIMRIQAQDGVSLKTFAETLLRPLDTLLIPLLTHSSQVVDPGWLNKLWSSYKAAHEMRIPFMGTLFIFASILWSISHISGNKLKKDDVPDQLAVAITVLFSLAMMFTMAHWLLNIPSGTWLYRDGLVLFGLLAAGRWLQIRLNEHSRLTQWLPLLLFLHMIQMIASSYPTLQNTISTDGMHYYENFRQKEGLPGWILSHANHTESRIFATVPFSVGCNFVEDGLYGVTDLTFLGLKPFNALFKSVSMDTIAQSMFLGHGWIRGYYDIISNKSMLDVFGIHLVIALDTELGDNLKLLNKRQSKFMLDRFGINISKPVDNLELLDERQSKFNGNPQKALLYRNNSAWPQAFLMDPLIVNIKERRACAYEGAVCRDFSDWKNYRLDDKLNMDGKDGSYIINLSPSKSERLFVTSKLYRPEWVALNGEGLLLSTEKVGGTLLGVHVPLGLREFTLEFRPRTRITLWVISIISLIVVVLTILLSSSYRIFVPRVRRKC